MPCGRRREADPPAKERQAGQKLKTRQKNAKSRIKGEAEKMPTVKNKATGKTGIERGFGGEEGPSAFPLPRIALLHYRVIEESY